jgi:hypothetical protein
MTHLLIVGKEAVKVDQETVRSPAGELSDKVHQAKPLRVRRFHYKNACDCSGVLP